MKKENLLKNHLLCVSTGQLYMIVYKKYYNVYLVLTHAPTTGVFRSVVCFYIFFFHQFMNNFWVFFFLPFLRLLFFFYIFFLLGWIATCQLRLKFTKFCTQEHYFIFKGIKGLDFFQFFFWFRKNAIIVWFKTVGNINILHLQLLWQRRK